MQILLDNTVFRRRIQNLLDESGFSQRKIVVSEKFKGLRPPAAGPPEEEGHEDTRPRGYEATGLEPRLEGLLGAFWGPLGASWGPPGAS